ncbi:MAG: hypothetical protein [Olavius algarvensis Delta 4 endosymbiont]|nr:MAG: hypothetical protein [Olavius algarvensis Delta 4 endosymbiont]
MTKTDTKQPELWNFADIVRLKLVDFNCGMILTFRGILP